MVQRSALPCIPRHVLTGFLSELMGISAQLDGVTGLDEPLSREETDVWAYGEHQGAPTHLDRATLERREAVKNLVRIQNRYDSEMRALQHGAPNQQQQLHQTLQDAANTGSEGGNQQEAAASQLPSSNQQVASGQPQDPVMLVISEDSEEVKIASQQPAQLEQISTPPNTGMTGNAAQHPAGSATSTGARIVARQPAVRGGAGGPAAGRGFGGVSDATHGDARFTLGGSAAGRGARGARLFNNAGSKTSAQQVVYGDQPKAAKTLKEILAKYDKSNLLLPKDAKPRVIRPATSAGPPKPTSVVLISGDSTLQANDSDVEEREEGDAGSDIEMADESSRGGAKPDAGSAPITGTGADSPASHTAHGAPTSQTSRQDSGSRGSQPGQEEEASTGNQRDQDRLASQKSAASASRPPGAPAPMVAPVMSQAKTASFENKAGGSGDKGALIVMRRQEGGSQQEQQQTSSQQEQQQQEPPHARPPKPAKPSGSENSMPAAFPDRRGQQDSWVGSQSMLTAAGQDQLV